MKHLFILIAFSTLLFSINGKAQQTPVSEIVKTSFYSSFDKKTDVKWSEFKGYYKAQLNINAVPVNVFYNENGELIAITNYISINELPDYLKNDLSARSKGFQIKELFQVSDNETSSYYVTLENEHQLIILQSNGSHWNTYKKIRK